jgi:hypothetical protein
LIEALCYKLEYAGSIPGDVIAFFFNLPDLPNQEFSWWGRKALPARKAENLAAICEQIV